MSELVDRDAVREFIMSYSHSTDVVYHMEKHLYEVPTIDAVPVVRCGECEKEQICRFAQYQGTNGFCSLRERRES